MEMNKTIQYWNWFNKLISEIHCAYNKPVSKCEEKKYTMTITKLNIMYKK